MSGNGDVFFKSLDFTWGGLLLVRTCLFTVTLVRFPSTAPTPLHCILLKKVECLSSRTHDCHIPGFSRVRFTSSGNLGKEVGFMRAKLQAGENAGWLEASWYVLASSQTPCLWWWWAWRRMLRWCRRKRKMADWSWWRMERWWQGNCESGYEMCFFLRKSRKIMNERNMVMITMMRMINEWKAVTYQRPSNWVVWDLAQLEHSWWCGGRMLGRRFHDWSLDL